MNFSIFIREIERREVYSVNEAHELVSNLFSELLNSECENDEVETILDHVIEIAKRIKETKTKVGTASEYHNLAVEYARADYEDISCDILEVAFSQVQCKDDVDLLSDYMKYCIASGRMETGYNCYKKLQQIEREKWNWRAYSFTIDFMLAAPKEYMFSMEGMLKIAEEFREMIPYSEEPFISIAEIYNAYNRHNDEELILLDAYKINDIKKTKVALRLADIYFSRGNYEDALNYAIKAYNSAVSTQASINYGYAYSIAALCRIALLFNTESDFDINTVIKEIRKEKRCAKDNDKTKAYRELERQFEILKIRYDIDGDYED